MSLKERGIKAEYLGSTQTDKTVHSHAESGTYDVLYMTPEKACSLTSRLGSFDCYALLHCCCNFME